MRPDTWTSPWGVQPTYQPQRRWRGAYSAVTISLDVEPRNPARRRRALENIRPASHAAAACLPASLQGARRSVAPAPDGRGGAPARRPASHAAGDRRRPSATRSGRGSESDDSLRPHARRPVLLLVRRDDADRAARPERDARSQNGNLRASSATLDFVLRSQSGGPSDNARDVGRRDLE